MCHVAVDLGDRPGAARPPTTTTIPTTASERSAISAADSANTRIPGRTFQRHRHDFRASPAWPQGGRRMDPSDVLPGLKPRRTSKPDLIEYGFSEPTATIVWGTLLSLGMGACEFVLWNAFPWHPFDERQGLLSNRRPTGKEQGNQYRWQDSEQPFHQRIRALREGWVVIAKASFSGTIRRCCGCRRAGRSSDAIPVRIACSYREACAVFRRA